MMNDGSLIGVKTTRIYCRSSCPAKSPLARNVVYFETPAQAERRGYRACKRCFPDVPIENWEDKGAAALLKLPKEFDFAKCLQFLNRSADEPCHLVRGDVLYKVLGLEDTPILLKIRLKGKRFLSMEFLTKPPRKSTRAKTAKYVWNWFDLNTDLKPFYRMAQGDAVLKHIASEFFGLRIVSIPDLFEALCWAIMGQHINLNFAYTLKRRFVESFGERCRIDGQLFYQFPTPEVISKQSVSKFKQLQFTAKKSEYIIGIANEMKDGSFSKEILLNKDGFASAKRELMRLHGVGRWTAEYVGLRCLKDPAAFPADDVGLQNAIKRLLRLSAKPSLDKIQQLSSAWKNWKAYAAFYLWHSLI